MVDLKWPNDVQHAGRKLCGVLAEASYGPRGVDVYLGVGVNLTASRDLPPDVAAIATSVEQSGGVVPERVTSRGRSVSPRT